MRIEEVRKAAYEADKFLKRCAEVEKVTPSASGYVWGSKETAALRRQSMELTRQLTKMRARGG